MHKMCRLLTVAQKKIQSIKSIVWFFVDTIPINSRLGNSQLIFFGLKLNEFASNVRKSVNFEKKDCAIFIIFFEALANIHTIDSIDWFFLGVLI